MNIKDIRKQVRNVVQEILPTVLTNVLIETFTKKISDKQEAEFKAMSGVVSAAQKAHLDRIEEHVKKELAAINKRSQSVQSWLLNTCRVKIEGQQSNMFITMLAWQELMGEKLASAGLAIDPATFNTEIDERKMAIHARLQKEAEDAMAAQTQAQQPPAEDAPKTDEPAEEAPPAPVSETPTADKASA